MNSTRLPYRHFLLAILVRSLVHAIAFAGTLSVAVSIVYGSQLISVLLFPIVSTMYITSYAIHELAHYICAVKVKANPILWIDYNAVSVLSEPHSARHGRYIALAGPIAAAVWIAAWWGVFSLFLPALCFAALIPGGLLASAHLGSLLPVFSDGKALMQHNVTRSYS